MLKSTIWKINLYIFIADECTLTIILVIIRVLINCNNCKTETKIKNSKKKTFLLLEIK